MLLLVDSLLHCSFLCAYNEVSRTCIYECVVQYTRRVYECVDNVSPRGHADVINNASVSRKLSGRVHKSRAAIKRPRSDAWL